MRFFPGIAKRALSFARKCTPSKLRSLINLVKPHLYSVCKNPRLFQTKLYFFHEAWRQGGVHGVIQRLQQSNALRAGFSLQSASDPEITKFMHELAASVRQRDSFILETKQKISIIIPVYRGLAETTRCIESVICSSNLTPYELIIINDASPEKEIDVFLNSLEGQYPNIQVLRNQENLGFVKTVNRGMKLANDADVVLLNSDTIVANDWLDRLISQAYRDDGIGTVTPFSNNATICSYPDLEGWPSLPTGENVSKLDMFFAAANQGKATEIPTAVGFCMYIKRSCLNDVGLFDEDAFGKGYGEENDFCLRASNKGWRHLLAADIFVFHEGEVSFSASASSKKSHAMNVIAKRYPNYGNLIASHIAKNPAHSYRVAATAARYRLDDRPVVLFITHTLGGGTEKHVQELARAVSQNNIRVLYLRPSKVGNGLGVTLDAHNESDRLKLQLTSNNLQLLAAVLRAFGISKVHIHHVAGFAFSVESLVTMLGVPYDLTVHDFYPICPRVNLVVPKQGYCGNPTVDDCNACLSKEPKIGEGVDIVWWRAKFSSLLNGANSVYCPSTDTANRILKHFPSAPVRVVPHENLSYPPARHSTAQRTLRRFALLGVLAQHKGLGLIEDALTVVEKKNLPIEFVLIGYSEHAIKNNKHFSQTGPYKDDELPALLEQFDPDAILFPAQCPETYSYTLSAAILSGRPIIVSDLGALPERVKDLNNSYVFSHNLSGQELVTYLATVKLEPADVAEENGKGAA